MEETPEVGNVRFAWLKAMYIYTVVGAGGLGLGVHAAPHLVQALLGFPAEDPVVFGIVGSVYTTFGLLSIFGLRAPIAFAPLLLLQLCYKVIWSVIIAAPLVFSGRPPIYAVLLLFIFATYIIGDIIAIPFPLIFSGKYNRTLPAEQTSGGEDKLQQVPSGE